MPQTVHFKSDLLARVFDFLLTRQEEKNIPRLFAGVDLNNGADGGFDIISLWLGGIVDFNGESSSGNRLERLKKINQKKYE